MGGNAFNTHTPPLPTPRMPRKIYTQVLEVTLSILRSHFTTAEAPIDAPGKETFGDVDILVAGPLLTSLDTTHTSKNEVATNLQKFLSAKAFIVEKNNPTINFAVPWPSDDTKYVQIDVHACTSPEALTWELFHSAHGDLWNILGTTIRPFGLTVNDSGMYLRIPSIELLDKKKSRVFLTSSPSLILSLLGLDEKKWWKEFSSQDEMFQYAASCKMFSVKDKVDEGVGEGDVVGIIEGQEGGEEGKKKLKHNDRARMEKRPIFASWIDGFIPDCREKGLYTTCSVTREDIRVEAFEMFSIKEEYETRESEWKMSRHLDELWRDTIKGTVPVEDVDPAFRGAAIRELKSVIMENEDFDGLKVEEVQKDKDGFYDLERVRQWVATNWMRAGEIGQEKMKERAREGQRVKAELKRKREAEREKGAVESKA